MRHLAQAATAKAEIAVIPARPAAYSAAVVQTDGWKLAFCGSHPAFALLINHRSLGHDSSSKKHLSMQASTPPIS
jgi:hypothetical protein